MYCNHAFFIGATAENCETLEKLQDLKGCCGIKLFAGSSTGNLLVDKEDDIEKVFKHASKVVAVHSEDEEILKIRKKLIEKGNVKTHPVWRNEEVAMSSTRKIVNIAERFKKKAHILHVTTRDEVDFLSQHKGNVSFEITPQHLTLSSPECYKENGTLVQMNPPIRSKYHQKELWNGIYNGTVDVIGSDHAPHTLEEKNNDYPNSPSGMPGIQTMLPLMLNEVSKKKLKLSKLVDLLCRRPAEIYRMKSRGLIQEGYKASLTVVDLNLTQSLDPKDIMSRCGWSPFTGKRLTGWPVVTIINGDVVMYKNKLVKRPNVYPVEFDKY